MNENHLFANAEAWLAYGLEREWVKVGCLTHAPLYTSDEIKRFDDGDEPCATVFRTVEK